MVENDEENELVISMLLLISLLHDFTLQPDYLFIGLVTFKSSWIDYFDRIQNRQAIYLQVLDPVRFEEFEFE